MKIKHILITGTVDNLADEAGDGTEFVMVAPEDATHVSVYLVDEHDEAEPVADHPIKEGGAYAGAAAMAEELAEQYSVRVADDYNKLASYLETTAKTCALLGVDLEAAKGASGKPSDVLYSHAKAMRDRILSLESALTQIRETSLTPARTMLQAIAMRELAVEALGGDYAPPRIKYDDTLLPFLAMMREELHANSGKGDREGWLAMEPWECLLELYYHMGKLQKAVKDRDVAGVREYSADVANLSMMLADIHGVFGDYHSEVAAASIARAKQMTAGQRAVLGHALLAAGGSMMFNPEQQFCQCPAGTDRTITQGGHFPACTACGHRIKE